MSRARRAHSMTNGTGCAEAGGEAQAGYYRLVTSLGERTAEPVPFVLE